MFCTGCGTPAAESDLFCGGCGYARRTADSGKEAHPVKPVFHVGQAMQQQAVPDGLKDWSWGAFFLNWIWAIGNNTWIGLLALIPYVNVPVAIWLGFKGREMAWRNGRWDSVDHFNRVQRKWAQWGVGIALTIVGVTVVFLMLIAYAGANRAGEDPDNAVVQEITALPKQIMGRD